MKLSLQLLDRIREEKLPLPGSINFKNAEQKIVIPIYQTIGLISMGVEGDPSGMKSGKPEAIRSVVANLHFEKEKDGWGLVMYTKEDIEHCVRVVEDLTAKKVREQISKEQAKPGTVKKKK